MSLTTAPGEPETNADYRVLKLNKVGAAPKRNTSSYEVLPLSFFSAIE